MARESSRVGPTIGGGGFRAGDWSFRLCLPTFCSASSSNQGKASKTLSGVVVFLPQNFLLLATQIHSLPRNYNTTHPTLFALLSLSLSPRHFSVSLRGVAERDPFFIQMASFRYSLNVLGILPTLILVLIMPSAVHAQSGAPASAPISDGTAIDQGIAYVLMFLALLVTYLIHSADVSGF